MLCEISKGTFEISHKILNPYTVKSAFYCHVFLRVSYDIFELWRHKALVRRAPELYIELRLIHEFDDNHVCYWVVVVVVVVLWLGWGYYIHSHNF